MLNTDTGELVEKVLEHEGEEVRKFYAALPKPVLVGIESHRINAVVSEADGRTRDRMPSG